MLRFFLDHHIQRETAAALTNAAVPRRAVPNKPYGFCGRYAPCLLTLPLRPRVASFWRGRKIIFQYAFEILAEEKTLPVSLVLYCEITC